MSFLSCPPETSHQIISYLDSSRDVAALSLACRALHSMCNMPMRKKFHLIRVYPDDEGIEQAFGLLMSILKQPSLGQYVREIRYYGRPTHSGDWENVKKEQHPRDLSESEMDLLKSYVRRAGFTGSNENSVLNMLVQKKTGGNRERESYFDGGYVSSNSYFRGIFIAQALTAILISVTPSLLSLAMTQPSATFHHVDRSYYPLEQFLHRANADPDNKSYLRNLHQVYIMVDEAGELDDSDFYIHIEFLESFQMFDKLPSIESVGIDAFRDDDQDEPTIEQGTSNLSKLYINHSSLNTHCIARAILSCRVLKELQYSIEGRAEHERDMKGPLNERTFTKAILGHKTTLESLDVDVGKDTSYLDRGREDRIEDERESRVMDYDEEDEISQFLTSFWGNSGSLKDFGALKRLSLGIGLLLYLAKGVSGAPGEEEEQVMLADCLPDNLEYLCIRGYQRGEIEKCDAQIDALMAAYKSGLTGLKEIRGVEEMIRYAENVEDPDEDGDLLWTLEGAGYGR